MRAYSLKKKALIISLLIVMITMTFLLFSCRPEGGMFGGSAEEVIETFEVRKGDIVQTVSTSGNVDSRYSNSYSLSSSGTVLMVLEEGDTFSSGDVLIKLDSSRAELLMVQAE